MVAEIMDGLPILIFEEYCPDTLGFASQCVLVHHLIVHSPQKTLLLCVASSCGRVVDGGLQGESLLCV